ncbi:MAG: ankyrin repeat domain-containing protein [Acidobacteriota bacterium]
MDTDFLPALLTIRAGKASDFRELLEGAPSLATRRSSSSHPTLLQALVLDGKPHPAEVQVEMARELMKRGALLEAPLIAAASVDNVVLAELLIDEGAGFAGSAELLDGWSPLEEALYWGSTAVRDLLLERGADASNLRTAAGLGRGDLLTSLLEGDPESWGILNSPWGASAPEGEVRQALLDNALSYAALENQLEAAHQLLDAGARPDALAPGFDYRGSALHWAAIRGHSKLCELLLLRGADPSLRDLKIEKTAAEWASHGGHHELAERLESDSSI